MSGTSTVGRRAFLRGAAVSAGSAFGAVSTARFARADPATTQAWQLDPSWGYPKGAHGRISCHCRACLSHAANKIFPTESAAEAGVAHAGCLCVPFDVVLDTDVYDALFTGPRAHAADRRDPEVQEILDDAPVGTFDAFSPDKGQVGHAVILTGSQFTGATRVMFGRLPALFTVDSATQITATVPAGARTGPIVVRMPGGAFSSVVRYVVKHPRQVTLSMNEAQTFGQVGVPDGLNACRQGVPVVLERLHGTTWNPIGRTHTRPDGSFSLRAMPAHGSYRAVAPWARLPTNDFCMVAISGVVTK
jgi:hypothetical protein